MLSVLLFVCFIASVSAGKCPFGFDKLMGNKEDAVAAKSSHSTSSLDEPVRASREQSPEYVTAALALDWDAVYNDIELLFKTNQSDIYPMDSMLDGTHSYAPFFIRQAWHCSGSYRVTDGLGGCTGGRQRFNPELSWPDNTNLDKGKRLLWPLKQKYGLGLSWGDLMILAGKVAIETGNGPSIGFCAGRPDQDDGTQSELLGPTQEQEVRIPCPVQGNCPYPFGADTIGLIYVNPGGFMDNYSLIDITAHQINVTFGRMTMDAEETVALIGGGHSFGKTHGACRVNSTTFPDPLQNPQNPWPIDACPNGTVTSGFEGYWTAHPRNFSNEFFQRLMYMVFEPKESSGGRFQYQSASAEANKMMLPSDVSLMTNPLYKSYVVAYANDTEYLKSVFGRAWYKLTTRDMGPISRCLNISIKGKYQLPPVQSFQNPVPPPPNPLANFADVKTAIRNVLYTSTNPIPGFAADVVNGQTYWGAAFSHLAFQCAATFRSTDHLGGCNGARIRLAPENEWIFNNGMDSVLSFLATAVKSQFGETLSFADLIVLAGTVAVEDASGLEVSFCGGRGDANHSLPLNAGKPAFNMSDVTLPFEWNARVMGLTAHELVAISARLRSPNQMSRMNYGNASWGRHVNVLSNEYFQVLLNQTWTTIVGPAGNMLYTNQDGTRVMTPTDMRILFHPPLKNIAQEFASDNLYFLQKFSSAWRKMMNADMYAGPVESLCPEF